jgi:YD repeat-containing protein
MRRFVLLLALALVCSWLERAFSQVAEPSQSDSVRVNVTINPDGSRTVYEFDKTNRRAVGTTTGVDGKLLGKIEYKLDEADRFESGRVFGPNGEFRFKTLYKYDAAGRLSEEIQRSESDTVLARIVYSYDKNGKQAGYSIFDGSGRLIGSTAKPTATPKSASKPGKR